MGLSKKAKRGIAIFNQIKNRPDNWRYSARRIKIAPPPIAPNILNAAHAAVEALNASVQVVPDDKINAQPEVTEGGAQHSIPPQLQDRAETEKGTPGGPQ